VDIARVGVLGCGLMGGGIAEVCALAGVPTRVREIDETTLAAGLAAIESRLRRSVSKERLTQERAASARGLIEGTTRLDDLADCDLVIEAITENREIKLATWRELDAACPARTLFASNTSSLSITEMAVATQRPDRFVGMHFFNPVPLMALVEIVRTMLSSEESIEAARGFAERIGKTAVIARDRTGFIVNRLLVPYMLDAIRVLEQGLATKEDIDRAMQMGAGYPTGPFALMDFVGLDTTYYIANIFHEEFREPRFAPPALLKRMVLAGRLGRKSGRGFYDYS
jgi:3-hydroxybutyryl-CoA dehydrogenase